MDAAKFKAASVIIKHEHLIGDNDEIVGEFSSDVVAWLDAMSDYCDAHLAARLQRKKRVGKTVGYTMEVLIQACHMGNSLRQDGQLLPAVKCGLMMLGLGANWLAGNAALPSQATISSARFTIDCGHEDDGVQLEQSDDEGFSLYGKQIYCEICGNNQKDTNGRQNT